MASYIYAVKYRFRWDNEDHILEMPCGSPDVEVAKKQAITVLDPENNGRGVIIDVECREAPETPDFCPVCHAGSVAKEPVNPVVCSVCGATVCGEHIKIPTPGVVWDVAKGDLDSGVCKICMEEELFEGDTVGDSVA